MYSGIGTPYALHTKVEIYGLGYEDGFMHLKEGNVIISGAERLNDGTLSAFAGKILHMTEDWFEAEITRVLTLGENSEDLKSRPHKPRRMTTFWWDWDRAEERDIWISNIYGTLVASGSRSEIARNAEALMRTGKVS